MVKRGMVIPVIEKYEGILIQNLKNMLTELNFKLPIELWQVGSEISEDATRKIQEMQLKYDIRFKNVEDYTNNPLHWKGYQIKAFIIKHTEFDEVILCDCDTMFVINPEIIFDDTMYISTGNFLFKDYLYHYPNSYTEIEDRIKFIRKLLPVPNAYFPIEWAYIYSGPYDHTKHSWYYQESSVLYINKGLHSDVVDTIYKLNDDWKETYKYILGDKETFWLAFVMHKKPFYMNPSPGYNHEVDLTKVNCNPNFVLTHKYKDMLCFSQKGYPVLN